MTKAISYTHPLDPLDAQEVKTCSRVCASRAADAGYRNVRFNLISLKEPRKAELLAYEADKSAVPARTAYCIVQAFPKSPVNEVEVELSGDSAKVTSWKQVKGVEPPLSPDDCSLGEKIAKADSQVQEQLKLRGVTNLDLVACDTWSVHMVPFEGRLMQMWMYYHNGSPDDNQYAHPLDFVPILDLHLGKVVRIDQPHHDKPPKMPSENYNYHRSFITDWRTDLKPWNVDQPEGPSFKVEGNSIVWQKWHIRTSFNSREGLVLHNVGYEDEGRVRPIIHRASLVEMAVPYGDPNAPFQRKCAFDMGDIGLGCCANSLALGCDCLGHIHYFDAVLNDSKGDAVMIPQAVCLHEEDAGILWKHMDYRTGHAEVRRSRRLVLSFISTVVNYEYAFYWYFYQDGTIKHEIKLTGMLSTNALSFGETAPEYGTLVVEGVNAQNHQHMFCARLDMAVDDDEGGKGLYVSEMHVEAMPDGKENPYGNGFVGVETPLTNEGSACRVADASKGTYWKINNPDSRKPVAYKLVPQISPTLMAKPYSLIAKRGRFASKHLWVTPHQDRERYPAGNWVLQSKGGEGLEEWIKQDRSVESGSDPVLWHCFGLTHIVRPEDFPVMPVESTGFTLKPSGFFRGNPGIDVPYQVNRASRLCCHDKATNGHSNINGHANGHASGHVNADA
ncbi:MAG: Cu2+-containing amine oxidase [Trebouxia sp. A1-2]|nr:MAG: Cu2+-containing amine oxidase [Trebouxia sp. A1-2]